VCGNRVEDKSQFFSSEKDLIHTIDEIEAKPQLKWLGFKGAGVVETGRVRLLGRIIKCT